MWSLILALLSALAGAPASAQDAAGAPAAETTGVIAPKVDPKAETKPVPREQNCLSAADMREVLESKRVIEPVSAIRAAQAAVPRSEIVRANLCRQDERLVYVLTALRRDGHFVHVTVNADSGKVAGLQ